MIDFKKTTIKELHEQLASGVISISDIEKTVHESIATQNDDIRAMIEVFTDTIPVFNSSSILSQIPVAVKDNILFKGKQATAGSHILDGYIASYDSKIAEIFNHQGAYVVGRTNMDELAMGSSTETSYYGVTKNPLDTSRVPGGSSGGSAAAVAAGMVMYALGSDTGGSIRQPAAYCGLVGLKPTYGAVSRRGLIAMASSLDVIGPITHNVEDAETVFDAISEYDDMDATCTPLETRLAYQEKNSNHKVIGVPRAFLNRDALHQDVLDTFNQSLDKMREQGYTIIDIDLPLIQHALAVYYILQPAEASSNLARFDGIRYGLSETGKDVLDGYVQTKTKGFGKEVQRRIMLGTHVLSSGYHDAYYYKALALRKSITDQVNEIFEHIDVIATPTTLGGAFMFGAKKDPISMYLEDIFTVPYNLTGHPAISIPSGVDAHNMPLGIHFTAPLFCEKKLFAIGKDFENTQK